MYYSKEEIQRANSVDLAAYFRSRGYECEKKGKDIHVKGFGGLYINSVDNTYYCFSKSKGGNAVTCLCNILNMNFVEAVKELLGESPVYHTGNVNSVNGNTKKDKEKCALEMPERADNYKRVFAYLSKTRKIAPDIIKALVDEKVLYQDKRGNAVFVHLDKDGQAVGAEITGTLTYSRFKGIATGTAESVFKVYKGEPDMKPDTAYIFESAVDMLSFIQLHPDITNAEFVSMAGLKDYAALQLAEQGMKIISCVDNDEAGKQFNKRMGEKSIGLQAVLNKHKLNFELQTAFGGKDDNAKTVSFAKLKIKDEECYYFKNHDEGKSVSKSFNVIEKFFAAPHAEEFFTINTECARENVKDFNELLSKKQPLNEKSSKPKQTMNDIMAAVVGKFQDKKNITNDKSKNELPINDKDL